MSTVNTVLGPELSDPLVSPASTAAKTAWVAGAGRAEAGAGRGERDRERAGPLALSSPRLRIASSGAFFFFSSRLALFDLSRGHGRSHG